MSIDAHAEGPSVEATSPSLLATTFISQQTLAPHLSISITQPTPSPQLGPIAPSSPTKTVRRSKSVSFAADIAPNMTQLATHRPSLPALSTSSSRRAQLALLAEQASLAAVGTSSLRIARAQSIVLDEAVKSAMGQAAQTKAEEGSVASTSSQPQRDPAWEQAFSSSDFLSSASSLAQMFHVQEQSRRDWAGQALALQRRRHTVASDRLFSAGRKNGKAAAKRRANDSDEDGESNNELLTASDANKKRRFTAADAASAKGKDRRVSFVVKEEEAADSSVDTTATEASSQAVERASSAARPAGSGSLANVLASFETLLDYRQRACAGLAELARSADEMDTFRSGAAIAPPIVAAVASTAVSAVAAVVGSKDAPASKLEEVEDGSSPTSSVFESSEEGSTPAVAA
ncbi:hypothetical protein BDZ90DRAFT_230539 [Jaminaea rosea]|uniref:Uncharacterized protein n=1 Tax=Jaminaea rosea TaxID=1569628 RepID=A0A316UWI9_9BASI|nr:hypothetical protein BDZ90DRAFT_230539 [Jaminaea rosea]PWN29677.1 hypothetical protein BDZ90DRAFT_230539 [Jaminaea rosea]